MEEYLACGEFTIDSMVRGHHVYQQVWIPVTGESLILGKKTMHDRYAVAVLQHDIIVGHLPRSISTVCLYKDAVVASYKHHGKYHGITENITGKLSCIWLPSELQKLQKFSPSNDLPCTVVYVMSPLWAEPCMVKETCSMLDICLY